MNKKHIILALLVCSIFVIAADFDRRKEALNPVARIEVPQITVNAGITTEQTDTVNANMRLKCVTITTNDNTNNATATLQIRDVDGAVLVNEAAILENAVTVFRDVNTANNTEIPMNIPLQGTITVGITPSGAPGISTLTADVVLYGD